MMLFAISLILLHISNIGAKIRVAYVFAGSARSFISPLVHLSIRYNLIESFCPSNLCEYDIFVRVSSNDNTHVGIDAKGTFLPSSNKTRETIFNALRAIEPLKESGSRLFIETYEIGSDDDWNTMVEFGMGDVRHKIYRELDTRRYSMYFGRWKAFEMMLNQEMRDNIAYTWVVHSRLDSAWGAPVYPFYTYHPDKLYAPDSWHVEIPDTFAIMYRNISRIYFGMDTLLAENVFCLGGPNLDTRKLEPSVLRNAGYSESEIRIIQKEDCRNKFSNYGIVRVPRLGMNWSVSGYSEYFLKRKMLNFGFNINEGSILLRPFFSVIVRVPQKLDCFWLSPYHLISWVKVRQPANSAQFSACLHLSDTLAYYTLEDDIKCNPRFPTLSTAPISSSDGSLCLLNKEHSDFDFMPYRIRNFRYCWTTDNLNSGIKISSCVNYNRVNRFMEQYAQNQMFQAFPLYSRPQKIISQKYIDNKHLSKHCLTADLPRTDVLDQFKKPETISLSMKSCSLTSNRKYPSIQMFQIQRINMSRIDNHAINKEESYHLPGRSKPLVAAIIKWRYPPSGETYCVHQIDAEEGQTFNLTHLFLKKCSRATGNLNKLSSEHGLFSFIFEKTKTYGEPYRPGITVGKYPTWADA